MKGNVFLIAGAVVCFAAGVVVMILGKLVVGLLLFILGIALGAWCITRTMKAGGYRQEGIFFNGLGGQGRQQSEVSKEPVNGGEQPENIWDQMTSREKA